MKLYNKYFLLTIVPGIFCLSVYFILRQRPDKALLMTLKGHTCAVTSVAISPDNKYIKSDAAHCCCFAGNKGDYLIGGNSTIYLKGLKGENIHKFRGHSNPVKALAVTSDGKTMVSASHDGTVKVWDIDGNR